eukprot:436883-Pleurochrysis_carterae.AAC.1
MCGRWAAPARAGSEMSIARQRTALRPKAGECGEGEVRRRVEVGCHEPPGGLPCASGGQRELEKHTELRQSYCARREARRRESHVTQAARRISPGSRTRATAYASAAARKARLSMMESAGATKAKRSRGHVNRVAAAAGSLAVAPAGRFSWPGVDEP